jgi:hypothetical protein
MVRALAGWMAGATLLTLTALYPPPVAWGSDPTEPAAPRRVVVISRQYRVWFVPTASPSQAADLLGRLGLRIIRADEAGRVYIIAIPEGVDEVEVLTTLRQSPLVLHVAPHVLVVYARKPVGPPPPKHPQL